MFGWHTPSDRDAVAAARRRLAAIAAQFATAEERSADQRPTHPDRPTPTAPAPRADDVDAGEPAQSGAALGGGRHAKSVVGADNRVGLSAHHVAIVAVTALVLLAVAAWWALRSVPHSHPAQLANERSLPAVVSSDLSAASTAGALPDPTPSGGAPASTSTPVVVDVAGRVRRPGIVELPAGSRVVDALTAAGGAKPGVDTRSLNLARLLVDGEQIVVGFDVPPMGGTAGPGAFSTPSTTVAIQPVDLNTATMEQLDTLPGIGPVTAQAILTWRDENGAFTSVDELLEVSGIGDVTLADIEPYVYV